MLTNAKYSAAAALLSLAALMIPTGISAQRTGVELWSQTCASCHLMQPANRYTADQWETIMAHMRIQARLTAEDAAAILEFLKGGARRASALGTSPGPAVLVRLASTDPTVHGVLATGREVYDRQCAACHGKEGKGDGPAAAVLNPRPPDLTDPERMRALSAEALLAVIRDGRGAMPGFASILSPEDLTAVRDYVRSLSEDQ